MRKLLTHYQLASIVESRKPENSKIRKEIAIRLARQAKLFFRQSESSLTMHDETLINYANSIRKSYEKNRYNLD